MAKRTTSKKRSSDKGRMRFGVAPLHGSFMLTAMLGFLISAFWVLPQSTKWGVAFMLVFVAMFIASLISMTKAPIID